MVAVGCIAVPDDPALGVQPVDDANARSAVPEGTSQAGLDGGSSVADDAAKIGDAAAFDAGVGNEAGPSTEAGPPIDPCAFANGGCGNLSEATCTNNGGKATCAKVTEIVLPRARVTGAVTGLSGGAKVSVTLANDGYIATQSVTNGQAYLFDKVPDGSYYLKFYAPGHATPETKKIRVAANATPWDELVFASSTAKLSADTFAYHWEQDVSRSGYEQSAYVNAPPSITFLNQPVTVPDLASADTLLHDYNVILSDEGTPWTQEASYRLLETMRSIPQTKRDSASVQTLKASKWVLSASQITNDIAVVNNASGDAVTLSEAALTYATPRLVLLDGVKGNFFSKRLHHALVRYVTQNGESLAAAEKILKERFGCSTVIPNYTTLTSATTTEAAGSFQPFHGSELVELITMFEEMPNGYHVVSGLSYLARRKDGMKHPLYDAPAVAWPSSGYIEFLDAAFSGNSDHMHRLILHEKSHFLWANVFSAKLRADWIAVGGWTPNVNDPDGWSTTKTTEFVTAYAHKKNPDEDMAESLSYFVLNPDALRSRSLPKFEFVRDRVMQGDRYISKIPTALSFEVLNLFPDYDFPGKIKRVDVTATGKSDQDKVVAVEIELNVVNNVFAGAKNANLRLFSEIGSFVDLWLYPTNASGSILRGEATFSKYAKAGLWKTDQIVVTDAVGNQRFEGMNDFGFRLAINNPLEDVTAPKYVPGTLTLTRADETYTEAGSSYPVQRVSVSFKVDEDKSMPSWQSVYATLSNPSVPAMYALEGWGSYDAVTQRGTVDFLLTNFVSSGSYGVPSVIMVDSAGNRRTQFFSASPQHEPLVSIPVTTTLADTTGPEVCLNDNIGQGLHAIRVAASPTKPNAPDGETLVKIQYQVRDDRAGLGVVSYRLLDPQGISHFQYHYHPNFYSVFFQGDPTAWTEYEINVVLPVGSAPGTWGLQELSLRDKAYNQRYYNFVETVRFSVTQ